MKRYLFPPINDITDYGSFEQLYDEVYNFVYEHVAFIDEPFYHILTAFIIATWRNEDFDTTPYLMFLGEYNSGKTRALEVLCELCYHAIMTSSISSAGLVRIVQKHRATLLIDETETLNNESKTELIGILNSGYKKGQYYVRAKQDSEDIETWITFGFKALSGTQDFVKTLNSRCIEIPMERATRPIPMKLDKAKASNLRMKLLDYRFKTLHKPLPNVDLPFTNGRNHELFAPLVQITPDKFKQIIIDYGLKLENNRNVEDATGFESDVLRSVLEVIKNKSCDRFKANDVFEEYKLVSEVDPEILNKEQKSYKNKIGRVLKNKFHLEKGHHKEYFVDKPKLLRMIQRYTPDLMNKVEEYLGNLDTYLTPEKSGQMGQSGLLDTNESPNSPDSPDSTSMPIEGFLRDG